jgi:hypothetical protein
MSCVWKGLVEGLQDALSIKITKEQLYKNIKRKNKKTFDMLWNDTKLTDKNLEENLEHIKELSEKDLTNGYLCSTCDPLLLLVGQIYKVSIQHNYAGTIIDYDNVNANIKMYFASNSYHFWFDKKAKKTQEKKRKREEDKIKKKLKKKQK